MKNSLLPFAVGVAASMVLPVPVHATEGTSDSTAIAGSDNPVQADSSAVEMATAVADSPNAEVSANPEMPVARETFYVDETSGALNFDPTAQRLAVAKALPPETVATPPATPATEAPAPTPQLPRDRAASVPSVAKDDLFSGGSESFVARTVGAAEGTRTPDGGKTQNYHGHVDPGNGVWNRGTFSYQFGNAENLSPDEADRRQLAKIQRIYESVMLPKAEKHGIAPLTLAEEINGIDLINQAPLTVTEDGGYIERLAAAKQKGLTGDEAILNARIWSFWDSQRGGWDAPGLRAYDDISKEESIRRDQDRRMAMIHKAMAAYKREQSEVAYRSSDGTAPTQPVNQAQRNAIADAIISAERRATRG